MWQPTLQKTQGFISRLLEKWRRKSGDMEHTQFHFKQIHHIKKSQEPLKADERSRAYIPKEAKTAYPGERAIEVRFCSTARRSHAHLHLYAARKDDDIVEVASGLITTGEQETIRGGQRCYYVEPILLKDNWLTPINTSGGRIIFRTHGYHRFFTRLKFESGEWFVDMVGSDTW